VGALCLVGGWLTYVGLVLQLAQGVAASFVTGATVWVAGGAAIIVGVIAYVNEGLSYFVGSTFWVNGNQGPFPSTYNGVYFLYDAVDCTEVKNANDPACAKVAPSGGSLATPNGLAPGAGLVLAGFTLYYNGQQVGGSVTTRARHSRELEVAQPRWLQTAPNNAVAYSSVYVGENIDVCELCSNPTRKLMTCMHTSAANI